MGKITTNLWFDHIAEEAVAYYLDVFKNSRIIEKTYYSNVGKEYHGMEEGTVLTITFEIEGIELVALNAGPEFKFNQSIFLAIDCQDQSEVDYYWNRFLADGGQASMCGWLEDKYGLSWQITPVEYYDLMRKADREQRARMDEELFKEVKLDIARLKAAFNNEKL